MSIKGRKPYKIYLDPEVVEYVVSFLETTHSKGGMSGLLNTYLEAMAKTIKLAGYNKGQEKVSAAKLFRIGLKGLKQMS